jgi:hypothetical protein
MRLRLSLTIRRLHTCAEKEKIEQTHELTAEMVYYSYLTMNHLS